MKQFKRRPGLALNTRIFFLAFFISLSLFATSKSYASGSKMPTVTDGETTVVDTPANSGGGTTRPSTGGGSSIPSSGGSGGGGATTTLEGNPFSRPWAKSGTSIVIDAYEGNSIDWDKMATDKKVVGVIHRSSIGSRVDKLYNSRKKIALERGYLWGAYHLGYRGNTIAQADLFISLVKDEPDTLMILDLENANSTTLMNIDEAVVFMNHVYEKTGRTPTVYANHSTTQLLNQKVKNNPRFQQSKLWYARFTSSVTDFPKGIWPTYFLWQFSSELNCSTTGSCLYNVPGTKADMDVNVFYGSPAELETQWNDN